MASQCNEPVNWNGFAFNFAKSRMLSRNDSIIWPIARKCSFESRTRSNPRSLNAAASQPGRPQPTKASISVMVRSKSFLFHALLVFVIFVDQLSIWATPFCRNCNMRVSSAGMPDRSGGRFRMSSSHASKCRSVSMRGGCKSWIEMGKSGKTLLSVMDSKRTSIA